MLISYIAGNVGYDDILLYMSFFSICRPACSRLIKNRRIDSTSIIHDCLYRATCAITHAVRHSSICQLYHQQKPLVLISRGFRFFLMHLITRV